MTIQTYFTYKHITHTNTQTLTQLLYYLYLFVLFICRCFTMNRRRSTARISRRYGNFLPLTALRPYETVAKHFLHHNFFIYVYVYICLYYSYIFDYIYVYIYMNIFVYIFESSNYIFFL